MSKLCKTNLNKNLIDKNKVYRENTQLRIIEESLLTYISL